MYELFGIRFLVYFVRCVCLCTSEAGVNSSVFEEGGGGVVDNSS